MSNSSIWDLADDRAALRRCDTNDYHCWHSRSDELTPFAEPILESQGFKRLGGITFLGILSPRFADVVQTPLFARRPRPLLCDGSRLSHCLGVALVALEMARVLLFSKRSQQYAVAWGLLHDIGNWPLSHTGEFAFSRITGRSTRDLRRRIILGDPKLPSSLELKKAIEQSGLDPATVVAFLDRRTEVLSDELVQLLALLKSSLSPDALEGMWRSGRSFGVSVAHPQAFTESYFVNLFRDIQLDRDCSSQAIQFWRQRRTIFRKFINRPATIAWESAWSQAILRRFATVGLVESLYLSETAIVSEILQSGEVRHAQLSRYKHPIEYVVEPKRRRTLSFNASLDELASILTERKLTLAHEDLHNVT